jgi:hypothetical protein
VAKEDSLSLLSYALTDIKTMSLDLDYCREWLCLIRLK